MSENRIVLKPDDIIPATEDQKQQLDVMRKGTTYWKDAWRRLKQNKVAMAAMFMLIFIILLAIIAPIVSPYTYDQQIRADARQGPSAKHWMGTDKHGRDIFVRLMIGTRVSLVIGLVSTAIVVVIGCTYGGLAAYLGGWADTIMMRIVDLLMSIPSLLIIILISIALRAPLKSLIEQGGPMSQISRLGAGLISIFAVFGLLYWTGMARSVRGALVSVRQQEYVLAAQAMGASGRHIVFRHMVPNGMGTIVIATTAQVPGAIFMESFLSFIGLGVSAPMASLGSMASSALDGFISFPHLLFFPSILLSLIILSFNLFGDGLRDALDPRQRK